jgi:hypothetical protein
MAWSHQMSAARANLDIRLETGLTSIIHQEKLGHFPSCAMLISDMP